MVCHATELLHLQQILLLCGTNQDEHRPIFQQVKFVATHEESFICVASKTLRVIVNEASGMVLIARRCNSPPAIRRDNRTLRRALLAELEPGVVIAGSDDTLAVLLVLAHDRVPIFYSQRPALIPGGCRRASRLWGLREGGAQNNNVAL